MDHTALIFLLDTAGQVLEVLPFGYGPQVVAEALRVYVSAGEAHRLRR
jgi:cytochrome oxidase Cu insertion factor (SCO1/SenC/PrrC family)